MLKPILLAVALLPGAWAQAASPSMEEERVAARLTLEATEVLNRLLGPGRASVFITVEGESSEIQTRSEILTPVTNLPKGSEMPGYASDLKLEHFQKDVESSSRRGSFSIRKITTSVVLDDSATKDEENSIRRILPQLLRLQTARGDDMSIVRAKLFPPWRSAWLSPSGMRLLPVFAGGAVLVLFVCLAGYVTAIRSVRVFAAEIMGRRNLPPPPAYSGPGWPGASVSPGDAGLMTAGGLPSLAEPVEDVTEGARPALGRRFDFLTGKPRGDVAALISKETPSDLALLFANLSDTDPDMASRLFSQLPAVLQAEVSQALTRLDISDPERLSMLESRLRTAVDFGVRGPEKLGKILSRLPSDERDGLLGDLMSWDPGKAESVEKSVFAFEGIAELKPEDLRRLIVTVPYKVWGTALRGMPEEIVSRVLQELPAGPRGTVRDVVDAPQSREKVLEARSQVLSNLFDLSAKGQVVIEREGASPELI